MVGSQNLQKNGKPDLGNRLKVKEFSKDKKQKAKKKKKTNAV